MSRADGHGKLKTDLPLIFARSRGPHRKPVAAPAARSNVGSGTGAVCLISWAFDASAKPSQQDDLVSGAPRPRQQGYEIGDWWRKTGPSFASSSARTDSTSIWRCRASYRCRRYSAYDHQSASLLPVPWLHRGQSGDDRQAVRVHVRTQDPPSCAPESVAVRIGRGPRRCEISALPSARRIDEAIAD